MALQNKGTFFLGHPVYDMEMYICLYICGYLGCMA